MSHQQDYGTALEKEAEQLAKRREEERARRTAVDFTHGGRQQPQQQQQQQQGRGALGSGPGGVGAMALAAAESAREKAARMQADAAARQVAAAGAKRPPSREGKRGNRWDQ